ncbi:unnamed protein product [Aspergillus oryzae RIB40]|uniref:DNA, SC026 n=1 Tax=Aspergillus oryzae (strain ATCC 42149 / RIB 40) TaxID=510516 RepID=Q2UE34_ASPOR|nr:unnamed protein product [Aspergillus oryzae RIB40]BAE60181.1 unnamed protein product [Aspergillus oryzae RIB40]
MTRPTSTRPSSAVSKRPTRTVSSSSRLSSPATIPAVLPTSTVSLSPLLLSYKQDTDEKGEIVLTHPANETSVLPNGTITGLYDSKTSHVGQIFFDQDLISVVEETSPYSTNTQELTTNAVDSILAEEAENIDPFVDAAAFYTEEGGVENENSGMGMGGAAPPSGSGVPSGAAPSGAAPSASASA